MLPACQRIMLQDATLPDIVVLRGRNEKISALQEHYALQQKRDELGPIGGLHADAGFGGKPSFYFSNGTVLSFA